MDDSPKGRRFSHVYLSEAEPLKDSKKVRFRIAKLVGSECASSSSRAGSNRPGLDHAKFVQNKLEKEIGISYVTRAPSGRLIHDWVLFFNKLTVPEFLDSITVVASYLKDTPSKEETRFVYEARRIFEEERLAYSVDDLGGIHPLIDAAFSAATRSAISSLNSERYSATAASVILIDDFLIQDPPNYVGAIRSIFGANENLFKLMYGVPRLDSRTAGDKLAADQQSLYVGQPTQQSVSAKMLGAFKEWINAAHFYRHEPGEAAPSQPSEEVAIMMVSQGLSYVRWLAQVDKKRQQ